MLIKIPTLMCSVFLLMLTPVNFAHAVTETITASKSVWVRDGNTSLFDNVAIQWSGTNAGFLQFDLSTIPSDAIIVDATLKLTTEALFSSKVLGVKQVPSYDALQWAALEWASSVSFDGNQDDATQSYVKDVLDPILLDVKTLIKNGVDTFRIARAVGELGGGKISGVGHATPENRPTLIINYVLPEVTVTPSHLSMSTHSDAAANNKIVTITNNTSDEINTIAIDDGGFTVISNCADTLAANSSCTVDISSDSVGLNYGVVKVTYADIAAVAHDLPIFIQTQETTSEYVERSIPPNIRSFRVYQAANRQTLPMDSVTVSGSTAYKLQFQLEGYADEYEMAYLLFKCSSPLNDDCANKISDAIATEVITPTKTELGISGFINFNGIKSNRYTYSGQFFTIPTLTSSDSLVVRFYTRKQVDSAARNHWSSTFVISDSAAPTHGALGRRIVIAK
ncbi:hypothetical protein RI844_07205 [Thalassotalea fonticola]|uniref:DNRLRE domain-containing protein n=1 Tax=Thalassotalea fonticola TaxID=3065649 RepID=A0ABZ0GT95_9GAMM|nr:hypothetical protein RI844_07205 [Colwelliaceae bacterium S1-1]